MAVCGILLGIIHQQFIVAASGVRADKQGLPESQAAIHRAKSLIGFPIYSNDLAFNHDIGLENDMSQNDLKGIRDDLSKHSGVKVRVLD